MRAMEFKYKDDINFITVNGVDPNNGTFLSRRSIIHSSDNLLPLLLSFVPLPLLPLLLSAHSAAIVGKFAVDGIPHMAFVDRGAQVLTALVGAVPAQMLSSEMEALVTVCC